MSYGTDTTNLPRISELKGIYGEEEAKYAARKWIHDKGCETSGSRRFSLLY